MNRKDELITEYLYKQFQDKNSKIKIGIIIKEIEDIKPEEIISKLVEKISPLYVSIVGYENVDEKIARTLLLSRNIEDAVRWRNTPVNAGRIIVFVKSNDTNKLHSLSEFDEITIKDISKFLISKEIEKSRSNTQLTDFWESIKNTSDYYTFEDLNDFVEKSHSEIRSIPKNMWRLNLLNDDAILGSKSKKDRLQDNWDLIFAMGQLSETARKKLSASLLKKPDLQETYTSIQNFYQSGKKDDLENLTYKNVQELFSSSQNKKVPNQINPANVLCNDTAPIRRKEFESIISDSIISNNNNDEHDNLVDLIDQISENSNNGNFTPVLGSRKLIIDRDREEIEKLVGEFCNDTSWGGIIRTDELTLKDAIYSLDRKEKELFDPCKNIKSKISEYPETDSHATPLFDFIKKFDKIIGSEFGIIIEKLITTRKELNQYMNVLIKCTPLSLWYKKEMRDSLLSYMETWERFYRALADNEVEMNTHSASGTNKLTNALLLLDVLYVKTPTEWKGILLPLHPIYLWPYYKIFQMLEKSGLSLNNSDKEPLRKTLSNLPHLPNFLIVNDNDGRIVLPASGNIDILPTFENKTNRYLGSDGSDSVKDILSRWMGYAPYTKSELRICSIDAPDLISILRQIQKLIDENSCDKVIYDVYLTRGQNSNTDLSKVDYSGDDFDISNYIRDNRITITINNEETSFDVKEKLKKRPVHIAFYFDQSSYKIEYGPNNQNLDINPLVVTYDYTYDEIQNVGSIFPSSETMDSGIIDGYNRLRRCAGLDSPTSTPRITCNNSKKESPLSVIANVVSTIKDGEVQWLVVADRDNNVYQPECAIPIGEKQYGRRMVNVWASNNSRIVNRYLKHLKSYPLAPEKNKLIYLLKKFGHISSNGLIGIPKLGANDQDSKNKTKGLLGTLFAASWYLKTYSEVSLVASLDDEKAKLWLRNNNYGDQRADLVGLTYDDKNDTLYVRVIEVKTRNVDNDYKIVKGKITGHAAQQISGVLKTLKDIFNSTNGNPADIFTSARREVFKYQIVSECFRNIHDAEWQKKWYEIFKRVFTKDRKCNIEVEGLLLDILLEETSGGGKIECQTEADDLPITVYILTSAEIQRDIFDYPEKKDDPDAKNAHGGLNSLSEPANLRVTECPHDETCAKNEQIGLFNDEPQKSEESTKEKFCKPVNCPEKDAEREEVAQLVRDFKRSCSDYNILLGECASDNIIIGPSVIRLRFKLGRGQQIQRLSDRLEDIGRGMKRQRLIIQQVNNSDELLLDIPRLSREKVLFKEIVDSLTKVTSPEQLYFPLGRTPNGEDLIENLGEMPHMLVGGSTGSGKSVLLFTMLAAFLKTHPSKYDLQLVLSSSKIEDFRSFQGLPHLSFSDGNIISDAKKATEVITRVIQDESNRRKNLLFESKVSNIIEYNRKNPNKKMPPIVVVIDEFADLADQLEKKKQDEFYTPVKMIAQTGRSRGIHLVICTQRPDRDLLPPKIKSQLNARVALRVTDGTNSRLIIDAPDAKNLQGNGDMIYKNSNRTERAQGYFISTDELDTIVENIKSENLG